MKKCPHCNTEYIQSISTGLICIECGHEEPPAQVKQIVQFKKQFASAMKDPYAPCYCGSGKKFKFCCRKK